MKVLKEIDFVKKSKSLTIGTNLLALALTLGVWLADWNYFMSYSYLALVAIPVVIVVHEALHGLLFWGWSKEVKFGYLTTSIGPSFYASSPGNRFSRNRFLAISLAPQLLTIAGLLVYFVGSVDWIRALALATAALNLGGGASDLYVVFKLLGYPRVVEVEDYTSGVRIYA